jgi:hypothetical protein
MVPQDKIIEIFCSVDDFCNAFESELKKHQLSDGKHKRNRAFTMSDSEVITIAVMFHLSGCRDFKHFYVGYICKHLQSDFPQTVSYNRFVELMQRALLPMVLYLKTCRMANCTGISFIDSTPIRVCHNRRIHNHKVFSGIAERGHCSIGWFFGFKLHNVINDKGEIIDFVITQGNVDDRHPLLSSNMLKNVWGKLFGDKGYLSQKLFETLFVDGIHLITKIRSNMKNSLMSLSDKIILRKRAVVESVIDELKNICQIEHSRHRSFKNFIVNLISGLIAYSFLPKKPSIQFEVVKSDQVALFY